MLGDAVADLLATMFTPGLASSDERRARRYVRRLRAGKEVRLTGTLVTARSRPPTGQVRLRSGEAWWRPLPATDHGEVLLCRGGVVTAVRPPSRRESAASGRLVVTLLDEDRRSSIVVPEPLVLVVLWAFPRVRPGS